MTSEFVIQWYPGHMAKAKRELAQQLRGVDFLIEVADARAPYTTRNDEFDRYAQGRPRLLILSKLDLAEAAAVKAWDAHFTSSGVDAVAASLHDGAQLRRLSAHLVRWLPAARGGGGPARPRLSGVAWPKGQTRRLRGVVVGMPNTGKSTLIRALGGRGVQTGALPGVTRRISWVRLNDQIEVLDTPGLMWPRSERGSVALKLAWLGCVGDAAFDVQSAAEALLSWALDVMPDALLSRYELDDVSRATPEELLAQIARRRGHLTQDGAPDHFQAAQTLLMEFRRGELGPVSLDEVPR